MERVVLITGCSAGIGRATARAFLDAEWSVMATSRDVTDVADLRAEGCRTASLDVTDSTAVRDVVEQTLDTMGRIDCLVNNAGYSQVGPVEDVPVERVHRQFDVNLYGPHRLARAVLPHMRARGDGTIVNVSSVVGRLAIPGAGVYASSKFALEAITAALRAEVRSCGVDVVLIEPGQVDTTFRARAGTELAALDRTAAYASLYRVLDDWHAIDGFGPFGIEESAVADAIVNAASATQPDARYVVGDVARLSMLGRFLPARLRDRIYQLIIDLTSYRSSA